MTRITLLIAAAAIAAGVFTVPQAAHASQLIDRGALGASLEVDAKGRALIEYRARGAMHHVIVWGAVNARAPSPRSPQVKFKVDYSGGWGAFGKVLYRDFKNTCRRYDGPKLLAFVAGCKATDGSYWALQAWQVELPDLGFVPWLSNQRLKRLVVSHWTGPVAKIEAYTDWVYGGRYHALFGRLTYRGVAVHGFKTTAHGQVLDGYGRNLYLDTYNSAYGQGWRRENGFVAHNPNGNFCYGFYPHDPTTGGYSHPPGVPGMRPTGNGSRYRLMVAGPGVTPDVSWEGVGLPDFDPDDETLVALQTSMHALSVKIAAGDPTCRQR